MSDSLVGVEDRETLVAEVSRLRSEVRQLEERIALLDRLAHQDWLIELPNRRGFMRQLEMLIAKVSRYGESAAMLFVDVDGLKLVNDTLGHHAGDHALIHVGELLAKGIRKDDCVARLGGDEFGILLCHANEESALETARRLIERIAEAKFAWDGVTLPLSVAIGVTAIQADDEPESVMCRADQAMYRHKPQLGRAPVRA
jgi:diguanylate cyclase (GGDEF)-like protein